MTDNLALRSRSPPKRRVWRWLLLMSAGPVLLIFAWLLAERLAGKGRLAKYERLLRSKGEKLTVAELIPIVTPGENGADDVIRLCGTLHKGTVLPTDAPPPRMRIVAPGKAMCGARQGAWLTQGEKGPITTNRWEAVAVDLEFNQQTLDAMRVALTKPVLYKRLNYEEGLKRLDMGHLMALKRGAQWLAASGLNHIHLGDAVSALEDVEALVALVRLQESEHLAIDQLVRWAIEYLAVTLTWEALEGTDWDEPSLRRVQELWAQLDFVGPVIAALRMERAMGRQYFDEARYSIDELATVHSWRAVDPIVDAVTGSSRPARRQTSLVDEVVTFLEKDGLETVRKGVLYPAWQFAWSQHDQRQSWLLFQMLIDGARSAHEARSAILLQKIEADVNSISQPGGLNRLRLLLSPVSGTLVDLPKRGFQAQTHAEMVVCAIALKRCQLSHGNYPDRLDDLVPEFLTTLPVDYMDGRTLRYRRVGDDFKLWSIGIDGKDDNGNPGTPDKQGEPKQIWEAPDAIWPRPASADAIREYQERKFRR
jgi:hypothetical protein